ncbi:MAG: glycosyltransferase [Dehalococcoidia bacterium]|nr:glycosyltransferase [Dehalococcoidia bacterium]
MKALFITPQSPFPPDKGTSLRNFNLLRGMTPAHEIHLLTFIEPGQQIASDSPLRSLCQSVHEVPAPPGRSKFQRLISTLLDPLPDMALRLRSREFSDKLAWLLDRERFDLVQVEGIEMAPYMDLILGGSRPPPVVIFDEHNAEYLLQRRAFENDLRSVIKWPGAFYSLVQWRKLRSYERQACRKASAVTAVSADDKKTILSLDPALQVAVVSNGIDCEFFQPIGQVDDQASPEAPGADPSLVFIGTMDYRPNVDAMIWFCKEVFPLVLRELPRARLQIVGRHPTKSLREAAGRNVDIVGGVEDVRPYMHRASVYVVPMRIGGGVRFKVLEAMACGVPVVSTRMGAEGIDVVDGEHLLLAELPSDYAARVVRLVKDRDLARTLAAKARKRSTSLYDWRIIAPRLEAVWRQQAREGSAR